MTLAIQNTSQYGDILSLPSNIENDFESKTSEVAIEGLKGSFINIYQNAAQISDPFSAEIVNSKTLLKYGPILKQILPETAFIYLEKGEGEIIAQSISQNEFSLACFYRTLIGHQVEIQGDVGFGIEVCGKVVDVTGNKLLILSEEEGLCNIPLDKILAVKSPKLENKIFLKPELNALYSTNQPEVIEGQVVSLNQGITWKAQYRLILEEQENGELTGKLMSQANIANKTQKRLKEVFVQVISGSIHLNQPHQPMPFVGHAEMRAFASNPQNPAVAAIDQLWEDHKAYLIPYKMDLKPAQEIATKLFDTEEKVVHKNYVLHHYEHEKGEKHPSIAYHLKNNQEGAHAFPEGKIQVYQKSQGQIDFIGEHLVPQTSAGKSLNIITGEAFDLHCKRSNKVKNIKNEKHETIAQEITVTLELSNAKDKDALICLHEHLSGDYTLISSNIEMNLQEDTEVLVSVPKKTSEKNPLIITYTYHKDLT